MSLSNGIVGGFGILGPSLADGIYSVSPVITTSNIGVLADGNLLLVKNDSFAVSDGRGLSWRASNWPSLAGASVSISISDLAGQTVYVSRLAGTVVDPSTVAFSLSSGQTDSLPLNPLTGKALFRFSVEAILASGNTVTLLVGKCACIAPAYAT
jgi:hypothetical protein